MTYLAILGGFALLLGGAEVLVRSSVTLARRLGVSQLVVGMTVIAFGTSAPEFVVTINAALSGVSGLAVGNVIGSNTANVLLILGVSALIMPIVYDRAAVRQDALVLALGTVCFAALCLAGEMTWYHGVLLLLLFAGFLYYSYWRETAGDQAHAGDLEAEAAEVTDLPLATIWLLAILALGLAGVLWGADILVRHGTELARHFGVPEEIIGLTLIAFGTSLPELATSITAALRGHSAVALGNVVGSNLFNALGVMGVAASLAPVTIAPEILTRDLWVMLASTALLLIALLFYTRLSRAVGAIFSVAYVGYLALLAIAP